MRHLLSMVACLAMVGLPAAAQEREDQKSNQTETRTQRQQGQQGQQRQQRQQGQQGQQQTIRGTVAGVTTIGEAVIDPQTNTAVAVQTNYLTVLGTPARGQQGQGRAANRQPAPPSAERTEGQRNQGGQNRQANRGRQNLYLIAISPQTKVRKGMQRADQEENAQTENQSAFDELEIGDRVTIEFKTTGRLNAKSQTGAENKTTAQSETESKDAAERTAGFRGDPKSSKHGRNRIFVGEASTITIMPADMGQQRGQNRERGQDRERNQNPERNQDRERQESDTDR